MADFQLKDIGKVVTGAADSVEETNKLITIWQILGIAGIITLIYTFKKYL
jgi:hypothetical protein